MRALRLVLAESVLLCLAGGLSGTLSAIAMLSMGGFAIGAEGASIAFRPSLSLFVNGMLVSLFVGLAAGTAPAISGDYVPIVHALKSE